MQYQGAVLVGRHLLVEAAPFAQLGHDPDCSALKFVLFQESEGVGVIWVGACVMYQQQNRFQVVDSVFFDL